MLLSADDCVGAVGLPVKAGDASGALRATAAVRAAAAVSPVSIKTPNS